MLLSDAIAMGRILIPEPSGMTFCRCAIGMGLAAVGHKFHVDPRDDSHGALEAAFDEWPWICGQMTNEISDRFTDVMFGASTLDQLIDFVRSVEPAEPPIAAEAASERNEQMRIAHYELSTGELR